jgi:hypothetical protein
MYYQQQHTCSGLGTASDGSYESLHIAFSVVVNRQICIKIILKIIIYFIIICFIIKNKI